jgi:hypothetical protein
VGVFYLGGIAVVGTYEIVREGRPVTAGLFKSADEIFTHVRALPPGVYDVYRVLPRDPNGILNSEYWGEVTKHEVGEVSYSPVRDPQRSPFP